MKCPICGDEMAQEPSLFPAGWFGKSADCTIHHCESCGHTVERRRGAKAVVLEEGTAPLDAIFQGQE